MRIFERNWLALEQIGNARSLNTGDFPGVIVVGQVSAVGLRDVRLLLTTWCAIQVDSHETEGGLNLFVIHKRGTASYCLAIVSTSDSERTEGLSLLLNFFS